MGNNTLNNFPDSHQVFVGNLPHQCQESDLEELFSKFGKVNKICFARKCKQHSTVLLDAFSKNEVNIFKRKQLFKSKCKIKIRNYFKAKVNNKQSKQISQM